MSSVSKRDFKTSVEVSSLGKQTPLVRENFYTELRSFGTLVQPRGPSRGGIQLILDNTNVERAATCLSRRKVEKKVRRPSPPRIVPIVVGFAERDIRNDPLKNFAWHF